MWGSRKTYLRVGCAGVIIFIGFLFLNNMFIDNSFKKLRTDYLAGQASIIAAIHNINPNLIGDVLNNGGDIEKGLDILSEYGYDENLNVEYFSSLNSNLESIKKQNIMINLAMICIMIVLIVVIVVFKERKLNALTKGVKETLEGNFNYDILKYEEGSYGKLAFAFDDVRKRLKSNLEDVNSKKTFLVDSISDISHQLKTPIASLKVYNDILEDENLDKDDRKMFIDNSKIQINRMEWLVQNLLKLAKIDAGSVIFNMEEQNINKTINEAVEALRDSIIEKNITINLSEEEILQVYDSGWIKEAFINIIKNAVEHSYVNKNIDIKVEDNTLYTKIIFRDYGKGIEKQEIPKIFNRFYKSKNNKSKESVGIGLALTKSIIDGHDGIVSCESEVGVGTSFIIILNKY